MIHTEILLFTRDPCRVWRSSGIRGGKDAAWMILSDRVIYTNGG